MYCYHGNVLSSVNSNEPVLLRSTEVRRTVPHLGRLAAGFSLWRAGFKLGTDHKRFDVDKVALEWVSYEHFGFSLADVNQLVFHIHLSTMRWMDIEPITYRTPPQTPSYPTIQGVRKRLYPVYQSIQPHLPVQPLCYDCPSSGVSQHCKHAIGICHASSVGVC
jgi:hypothetical protein